MTQLKKVSENLEWSNIDHEIYRVYEFPDGISVRIDFPVLLNVSKSGGHRILDKNNISHYIPSGWMHLYWETDDDTAIRF